MSIASKVRSGEMDKDTADKWAELVVGVIEMADENEESPFYNVSQIAEAIAEEIDRKYVGPPWIRQVVSYIHSDQWGGPEVFFDFYAKGDERVWATELTHAEAWSSHATHAAVCKNGTGENQRGNFLNVQKSKALKKYREEVADRLAKGRIADPLSPITTAIADRLTSSERSAFATHLKNELALLNAGEN